jgi:hypothetical protein
MEPESAFVKKVYSKIKNICLQSRRNAGHYASGQWNELKARTSEGRFIP